MKKIMKLLELEPKQLVEFKAAEIFSITEEQSQLWVNNVFGINKDGQLPARFLSGFLSTFSLAKTIQEQSNGAIKPHVRIFRPTHISSFINDIPQETVVSQMQQGNQALELLASRHFPDIEFFIEDDKPINQASLAVLQAVYKVLELHSDSEVIQQVRESGRRRGAERGEKQALLYVAHHPFGWSDLHHETIFERKPPQMVINTLPPSERKFTDFRQRLKHTIPETLMPLVAQGMRKELIISMCGTPHYLFLGDSSNNKLEPTLSEVLSITCQEILDDMRRRFQTEEDPFLKENLRRAFRDMEKLLLVLSSNNKDMLKETTFEIVMKGVQ